MSSWKYNCWEIGSIQLTAMFIANVQPEVLTSYCARSNMHFTQSDDDYNDANYFVLLILCH